MMFGLCLLVEGAGLADQMQDLTGDVGALHAPIVRVLDDNRAYYRYAESAWDRCKGKEGIPDAWPQPTEKSDDLVKQLRHMSATLAIIRQVVEKIIAENTVYRQRNNILPAPSQIADVEPPEPDPSPYAEAWFYKEIGKMIEEVRAMPIPNECRVGLEGHYTFNSLFDSELKTLLRFKLQQRERDLASYNDALRMLYVIQGKQAVIDALIKAREAYVPDLKERADKILHDAQEQQRKIRAQKTLCEHKKRTELAWINLDDTYLRDLARTESESLTQNIQDLSSEEVVFEAEINMINNLLAKAQNAEKAHDYRLVAQYYEDIRWRLNRDGEIIFPAIDCERRMRYLKN